MHDNPTKSQEHPWCDLLDSSSNVDETYHDCNCLCFVVIFNQSMFNYYKFPIIGEGINMH
jgi:hypothetical protein